LELARTIDPTFYAEIDRPFHFNVTGNENMTNSSSTLKSSFTAAFKTVGIDLEPNVERDDVQRINNVLIPLLVFSVAAAIWVGWKAGSVGPVLLWVFACLAAGGTTGFLFGIPKSGTKIENPNSLSVGASAGPSTAKRARPNTNLEEVSDWLTKIIVGLALVNLKELREEVGRISLNAASAIRPIPTDNDVSAATALVVGFSLIGFLAVYLYMRLFVQGAIVRSDDQIHQYWSAVVRAEQIGQQEPESNHEVAVPAIPSSASLSAAQEVANAAPPNQPELVLQPLRQLANQYEGLRQAKAYSSERTQQMNEIVQRMRPHAIAAAPYIDELMKSASTGDHLAATIVLQMKYMREHLQWLSRRLVEERAFIGYQAASALLARVRVAGIPECKEIRAAVKNAKDERKQLEIDEPSLDRLIDQILDER
jgi:hypothetical protein